MFLFLKVGLLLLYIALTGCGSPTAIPMPNVGDQGWSVDYFIGEAPTRFCRIVNMEGDIYQTCKGHPAFLSTALYHPVESSRSATIRSAFEKVDWHAELAEAETTIKDPILIIRRFSKQQSIGRNEERSATITRFSSTLRDVLRKEQRLVREANTDRAGIRCSGCPSTQYCIIVRKCPPESNDGRFCGAPFNVCEAKLQIGDECTRDDACPNACVGIFGTCE